MLFDASTTYAPGEPRGNVGYSNYQNMTPLGRYNLPKAVTSPNVWVAAAVIVAALWLAHKGLGGRK